MGMHSATDFFRISFSKNLTLILLFYNFFFQHPLCLRHMSVETILCAVIRHPLAGHSVLYTLSFFLQFLLIFFYERGPMFSPLALSGARICSIMAGPHWPVPQPMRGALFLLQLVPSLRNPLDFISEFFFWCRCLLFFTPR